MLKIGLLWYDDTKRDLADKIAAAIAHYEQKNGQQPNVCCIALSHKSAGLDKVQETLIIPIRHILPNHFWLGMDEPKPRRADSPDTVRRPGRECPALNE